MNNFHTPVLLNEVIKLLSLKPNHNVIDCTLGGGGHAEAIIKKIAPDGKLLGIDADSEAVKAVESRIKNDELRKRFILVQDNFRNLESIVKRINFPSVNAVLLDLGMSSHQIDQEKRGFSFKYDSPLDMTFEGKGGISPKSGINAFEVINKYPKQRLKEILKSYGEVKQAGLIADRIDRARKTKPILTTSMLVKAIAGSRHALTLRKPYIKLLAKVWQAIRIEVNQELVNLQNTLPQIVEVLAEGGRVAVISYHSLEDRIVKQFFHTESAICVCPKEMPLCRCFHKSRLKIVVNKAVVPSYEEIINNPRARSAKLRAAEKRL